MNVTSAGDNCRPPLCATNSTAVFSSSPSASPPAHKKCAVVIDLFTPSPVAKNDDKVTYYPARPPRHRDSRIKRHVSRSFGHRNTGSIEWKDDAISKALTLALSLMVEANEAAGFLGIEEDFPCFYSEERQPHGLESWVDRQIQHSNCSKSVLCCTLVKFEYVKRAPKKCKLFVKNFLSKT